MTRGARRGTTAATRAAASAAAALAALVVLTVGPAQARSGPLDPSFGSSGKVVTDFGPGYDEANAVVVQPDGKILAGGAAGTLGGDSSFALARYTKRGTLDTSFGSSGKVTTQFGAYEDWVTALLLQPDRRIVAVGYALQGNQNNAALARYNPDGSLDTTFGSAGKVTRPGSALGATRQRDGKILVAGSLGYDFFVARYDANGVPDATFGTGGFVRTDVVGLDIAFAVTVQTDGKIVVAGSTYDGVSSKWALVRYLPDGSRDATFDVDGRVVSPIAGSSGFSSVRALPNGKILAAGYADAGVAQRYLFALARYNADGTLDATFGVGGVVTTQVGSVAGIRTAALQLNGKIVVAGYAREGSSNRLVFALARYRPNGALDTAFGFGGTVTTAVSQSGDSLYDMALQPDGNIVVAGSAELVPGGEDWAFGLARILGDTCIVPNVKGRSLTAARKAVRKAGCSVGKVRRRFSSKVAKGKVIAATPAPKSRVAAATKVNLTASKGRRR